MRRAASLSVLSIAAVTFAVAAGACSDDKKTNDLPPVRSPERGTSGGDSGSPADGGTGAPPTNDASSVDTSTCKNGVKDGDETDVDCGGATCSPCANGKACAARRDCLGLVCAGATCSGDIGCSDGTREGFAAIATFPNIAACSGGWSLPGVLAGSLTPACGRLSGNSSTNPSGNGCNAADLCQVGWHVCNDAPDVANKSGGSGCANAAFPADTFYATRQSGTGSALCEATGANDVFGCGTLGATPDPGTCGVLDRFSNDLCASLPMTFACGADGLEEANNVTKSGDAGGGVLCCRD